MGEAFFLSYKKSKTEFHTQSTGTKWKYPEVHNN